MADIRAMLAAAADDLDGVFSRNAWVGVLLAILGNVLISVSLNLQKHVHMRIRSADDEAAEILYDQIPQLATARAPPAAVTSSASSASRPGSPSQTSTEYLRQPVWWLGMTLMVCGELGNFMAYGWAPAILVAPLGTVALISNAVLAPIFLKEKMMRNHVIGIGLAVLGTVMIIVASSQTNEPVLTPESVSAAIRGAPFVIYLIVMVLLAAGMTYLSRTLEQPSIFVYLSLVGIYGGFTVISTKATSALVNLSFFRFFTYPISYLMLAILVSSAIAQIFYLQEALARYDSVQVIPTQFVFFTVSAIVGSAVTYNDFGHMQPVPATMSLVSVCVMFCGVWFITKQNPAAGGAADADAASLAAQHSITAALGGVSGRAGSAFSYHAVGDKDSSNGGSVAGGGERAKLVVDDFEDSPVLPPQRPGDCIIVDPRGGAANPSPHRKISLGNILDSVGTRYPRHVEFSQIMSSYSSAHQHHPASPADELHHLATRSPRRAQPKQALPGGRAQNASDATLADSGVGENDNNDIELDVQLE